MQLIPLLIFSSIVSLCIGLFCQPAIAKTNGIMVIDGLGRQVTVPRQINRIVTNYGIAAHMIFVLGEWEKLVGIDGHSKKNRFFKSIHPQFSSIKITGTVSDVNVETVLSLEPDLILVPGRNKRMVNQLASYGLPVFAVIAENLGQIQDTIHNLGIALGQQKKAGQYISYYSNTINLVNKRLGNLIPEDRPIIYLAGPMGILSTCSKDMYQHNLIDVCGGINAGGIVAGNGARHGWAEISAELLFKWDPDNILVVRYSGTSPEDIIKDRRWKKLKAVKNKKVLYFPSSLNPWDYPSPQAALGIHWLAATLYPDKFADIKTLDEANSFYKTFYGKTFEELGGKLYLQP